MDFYGPIYNVTEQKSFKNRRNSFSSFDLMDKNSLQLKDDIFVANLMASLNPEPGELQKRLKSQIPMNHVRIRCAKQLEARQAKNLDGLFES